MTSSAPKLSRFVHFTVLRAAAVALAGCLVWAASPLSAQTLVDLGEASNYALLGSNLNFHKVTVNGAAGVGSGGYVSITGPSTLNGDLFLDSGATYSIMGTHNGNLIQPFDVDQALADAASASQIAAGLTANFTYASLTSSLTIQSVGAQTVVNVTGSVNLSGENVYFTGNAGDKLIINVWGGFTLGGAAEIGAQPGALVDGGDVIINLIGAGSVSTSISDMVYGTLLGVDRSFNVHNVTGAMIGGDLEMKMQSDGVVNHISYLPPDLSPPVPEPSSLMLVAAGVMLCASRRSRSA